MTTTPPAGPLPSVTSVDAAFGFDLAAVAARHGGVVLASELLARGLSSIELSRRVRRRLYVRIRRGAYVTTERWDAADERIRHLLVARAVQRSLLGENWFTSVTGLLAHDVDLYQPDLSLVHVVRSNDAAASRTEAGCMHSLGRLPESQRGSASGLPVASPARCLIDYARYPRTDEAQAVVAMDSALRRGLVEHGELRALVEDMRDWPGSLAAGRAQAGADGRAESPGESLTRLIVTRLGFPPEELQIEIRTPDGTFRADMGWPSLQVLLEFDGKWKFSRYLKPGETAADAAWRERRREIALERAGWIVVRICWADLFDEARLLAILLDAFARATARQRVS